MKNPGALQSLLLDSVVPVKATGRIVVLRGLCGVKSVPIASVFLQSDLFVGQVSVGVVSVLPVSGVDFIMGNNLAGGRVHAVPVVSELLVNLEETDNLVQELPGVFPVCAVTRSMSARREECVHVVKHPLTEDERDFDLGELFESDPTMCSSATRAEINNDDVGLIESQQSDPDLKPLTEVAEGDDPSEPYYFKNFGLMRRWRTVIQVVVPSKYRNNILSLAHDSNFAGHLGVRKTLDKIWKYFYWPGIRRDVAQYVRMCHVCQIVGKPNQTRLHPYLLFHLVMSLLRGSR